jgi:putative ABC transport system permease protein
MVNDLRYAFRMFCKNPGFTAVAVLTLAVGIGGTTAIFSVIQGAVLDPFPYADSHRLAVLVTQDPCTGTNGLWAWVSGRDLQRYQELSSVFDEVIGAAGDDVLMKRDEGAVDLFGVRVTSNFFRVLGVPTLMGRPLSHEDAKPSAPPVVVLSFKGWRSHFGGDAAVVGRTFVMDDQPTTVIGVMPPRFHWLGADSWLPATLSRDKTTDQSRSYAYSVVGRLKPGVSIKEANAEVKVLAKRLASAYPDEHPKEVTFRVEPLPIAAIGHFRITLYFLLGAVALLLLIACGNVANMLLARAIEREKEFSIRASLGAGRLQLFRQLILESLLFACCGGCAGTLLAVYLLDGLLAVMPPGLPSEALVRVNGPVLLFTLGVTLICTLISGLAPALRVLGRNLQEPLKAASRRGGESSHHSRMHKLFVVSEVVVSLVLLSSAGLLMRSFIALHQVDLRFDPDHVLGGGTSLPETRYRTPEQRVQFQLEALRRVRTLPGVVSAALTLPSPMNYGARTGIEIGGKPGGDDQWAFQSFCSDRCFETVRIPLLEGRSFSEEDLARARNVAIVNQAFVNRFFRGMRPLGERVKVKEFLPWGGPVAVKNPWFEVVGVASDVRGGGPEGPIVPQIYIPFTLGGIHSVTLTVRSEGDPAYMAKAVQQTIWSMDKELLVRFSSETARDDLRRGYFSQPRFVTAMALAFAALGLLLVSVGVYSVLSYAVSRRTQEIGIRMALGAQTADVRRMVMMSGLRWMAVGIGIGVPASIALAKILQSRIWGIKSADPVTLILVSLVLTAVGLAACFFPARRATSVDPMVALRCE